MKIKLVLIDTYDTQGSTGEKIKYYVGENVTHVDEWIYSPYVCEKIIKTTFE